MKFETVDIDNYIENPETFKQDLSFECLIEYLKNNIASLGEHEREFPQLILDRIYALQSEHGEVTFDNYESYEEIFNYVYYLTSNVLNQDEVFWALGFPIPSKAFYGQEIFYSLLDNHIARINQQTSLPFYQDYDFPNKLLYLFILNKLYDLPVLNIKQLYRRIENGVTKYYQLKVDFTFLDVNLKDVLPELDLSSIRNKEIKDFSDIAPVLDSVDLDSFTFKGFTILKFFDKTNEFVNDKIHGLINKLPSTDNINEISKFNRSRFWDEIKDIIHTLACSTKIQSSFFPLLELNGFPVLASDLGQDSIFFGDLIRREKISCHNTIHSYLKMPYTLTYGVDDNIKPKDAVITEHLNEVGVRSLVCFPLKNKDKLVGFLEFYSFEEKINKAQIINISSFLPGFINLASDLVATFKNSMDKVILDKYTSLQEAVQWRFNQVAANYLSEVSLNNPDYQLAEIKFENVFPIYGAVDIRNSTQIRNMVYKKDSYHRIGMLQLIVDQLEVSSTVEDHSKFIQRFYTVKDWLDSGRVDYYLLDILSFFNEDVMQFLNLLHTDDVLLNKLLNKYLAVNSGKFGVVNGASEDFEVTLAKLNTIISAELEIFNSQIQSLYPSYFQKFRTDGIEYDLYMGQSITPNKIFNASILRNVRKQQIKSMAAIARKTSSVIDELPITLVTTHLIFVHPNTIDISFRQDERRFDVDGGYNIRYEVIKKRIDKALVKGTNERLVQPNKIAIVYSSNRIHDELNQILEDLIEEKIIGTEIESIMLDELQGIDELRAFRVNVI